MLLLRNCNQELLMAWAGWRQVSPEGCCCGVARPLKQIQTAISDILWAYACYLA